MAATRRTSGGSGKWVLIFLAFLTVGVAAWWKFRGGDIEPAAGPGKGGVAVEVATAQTGAIAETLNVAGQVAANFGTELRSEVTGRVVSLNFKDGQKVKKGDVLVTLDDSVQKATLAQADANFALAEANVGRYQRLVDVGAASKLQVDQAVAEGKLQRANIAMARANLAKYRIAAPFDGVAGIAQVTPGDLVQPGELLVAVTDNDTLKVTFKVPEAQATSLLVGAPVEVRADGRIGDLSPTLLEGKVEALDGRVDPSSRTLEGKILIDNADGAMVAGQFVRVNVPVRSVSDAVVVPDSALLPQGDKKFMFIIVPGKDGGHMASKTTVTIGLRTDNKVQVLAGVQAGQQVVTAGQQKLQAPSTAVRLNSPTLVDVPEAAVEELR